MRILGQAGLDLRGHENNEYAQCTAEDAGHAMKVVHLRSPMPAQLKKRIAHPAGVVDLQAVKEFPADSLVADGGEHPSSTSCW